MATIATGVEIVSDRPAATLLLPYFEVNLKKPKAGTTLLSINDASATAALTHVVVWSDLSVPVFEFNVYLTGYNVYRLDLASLIGKGIAPQTASAGQDPHDTISPKGIFSQHINFASCNGILPNPPLTADQVAGLQAALTGKPSSLLGNQCAGVDHGDNVARGYITVDTVNNCTQKFPGDPGYFGAGGTGDATNQNILWGDSFYINQTSKSAFAQPLVHILANASDPLTSTSGNYTFYGRYDNFTAIDNRQPLSTTFASRFINGASDQGKQFFSGGTSLIVWRDSKVQQAPFSCPASVGSAPAWSPLTEEAIVAFDEQEHPQIPVTTGSSVFPIEAQNIVVGGAALPTSFSSGWLYLDFNFTSGVNPTQPTADPAAAQAWAITTFAKAGAKSYRLGERAIMIDSAVKPNHFYPHP